MKTPVFKRVGTLLLALVMLLSLTAMVFAEGTRGAPRFQNPFKDVKAGKYYYDAVLWAYNHEPRIASGMDDTHFGVSKSCTRAQIAVFLYAAAGKPPVGSVENPFKDVKKGKWYYDAIMWAVQNGITGGLTNTTFGINESCTRAQAVTFLYAMAGKPEVDAANNPFTDVPKNKWFHDAVIWAYENGITGGTTATTFSPNAKCTRAQIVSFLFKAVNEYEGFVSKLNQNGRYSRSSDDEAIYQDNFGDYSALMEQARNADSIEERWMLYAQAEAALLDTAAIIPTTTQGGSYAMSRVAPHTVPFTKCGSDSKRFSGMIVSADFLSRSERRELESMWKAAVAGRGSYDPAAYLSAKGHTLQTSYSTLCTLALKTLDWMATSASSNTDVLANCVEGLVQYDNLGYLQPALAESWEVSPDGKTYTFHLRRGVKWYTADGSVYAELTANDFVAGFRHMLDCRAGLESLAGYGGANIVGVNDYLWGEGTFDEVGCKATNAYTLVYTLNAPCSFFTSLLTYNIFLPICDSFYRSCGGVYGIEEYATARDNGSISYGSCYTPSSQVYCGPFLLQFSSNDEIRVIKNTGYYGAARVTLNTIRWLNSSNMYSVDIYNMAINGSLSDISLMQANGTLESAKEDGYFDTYAFVTDTTTTTFFGALNLNRGRFCLDGGACASPKDEKAKADAATALNNKNFRKALQHAFDKVRYNTVTRGEDLAETNLRNMLTPPDFVKLEKAVTDQNGHKFPVGTFYGDMVQYYCNQLGCEVNCADGQDGWYKPEEARAYLQAARIELGGNVTWPIQIDLVYYGFSTANAEQAAAYKAAIEETLGKKYVIVNLVEATDSTDYYNCGYFVEKGEDTNTDMFYGSGWGPDYSDPSTFLNIFDPAVDGYMLRMTGLY